LVGLVMVMGVIAFVGLYSTSKRSFSGSDGGYTVYALFEDVSGLGPRTRVALAGVQVGEISDVSIDTEHPDKARVTVILQRGLKLQEGIKQASGHWKSGATLTRKQASLLGDQYLELQRGLQGRVLGDGDEVKNVVAVSGLGAVFKSMERTGSIFDRLDNTFAKLDEIATDVKKVTGTVSNILGGEKGGKRLENIAANIDKASSDLTVLAAEVKDFAGEFRAFMGDSILGRGKQIGRIVNNVEKFSRNAAGLSGTASATVTSILGDVKSVTRDVRKLISGSKGDMENSLGTIKGAMASFTKSLQRVEGTLDHIGSISKKIDEGEGTLGVLVNDDKVIKDIEAIIEDTGDLVKRVTQLKTRVELESEYYVDEQALKNYLRLRLQPREDKYYLLEIIDDPRGKTTSSSVVTQTNDPNLPPVVHETSESTDQGIKVSFQFAKKWYFLTGRFGIFEGSGGLGMDLEFFNQRLKLSADVFDFTSDEEPRLRFLANYEFLKHFYFTAGLDDVMNAGRFDYFFGGGLRFTDHDLKALMTVAPFPGL
jgi:phospholipid/cholesterol/gamma-HCH transport system substrate-binding protein